MDSQAVAEQPMAHLVLWAVIWQLVEFYVQMGQMPNFRSFSYNGTSMTQSSSAPGGRVLQFVASGD